MMVSRQRAADAAAFCFAMGGTYGDLTFDEREAVSRQGSDSDYIARMTDHATV